MDNTILITMFLVLFVCFLFCFLSFLLIRKKRINESDIYRVKDELKKANEESFSLIRDENERNISKIREENRAYENKLDGDIRTLSASFTSFNSSYMSLLKNESDVQNRRNNELQQTLNSNFDRIREENRNFFKDISLSSDKLTSSVKEGMVEIRESNEKKLKEIQNVVDIKLQETLNERIASSFKSVTENLSKLYTAMGSLDNLSKDLKKMNSLFSNVKSRGVWGEMQAENILSDILTQSQWVKNFSPRNNNERVEFAIKMPGKESEVYLPIDSKFPLSDLERYIQAVDSLDEEKIKIEQKNLSKRISDEVKDINKKYIVPPVTTDFAILFLPSETLYLEVLKIEGFVEKLQNDFRVVITGPNNFSALLNSLALGFRTMQIEEYTSTIWHLFEDLKKLFTDLSKSVDDSKKHIDKAQESLDGVKRKKEKISNVLDKIEKNAEKVQIEDNGQYLELEEYKAEDETFSTL